MDFGHGTETTRSASMKMKRKDRKNNSKSTKVSRSNVGLRLRDELDSSTRGCLRQKLASAVNRNDCKAKEPVAEADFEAVHAIEHARLPNHGTDCA